MTMGIVRSLPWLRVYLPDRRDDDVYLETHKLGRKRALAIAFSLSRSPLNDNVFSLDVAKLAQTLPECLDAGRAAEREDDVRYPIRGIFVGCCASAQPR